MSSQMTQLAIAYGVTAAAMLVALLIMRADGRAYWRWPVYSVMAMALGVVVWNLLLKHAVPLSWSLAHPGRMFAAALALYALFGMGLGLLVGRLTRRAVAQPADSPEDSGPRGRET